MNIEELVRKHRLVSDQVDAKELTIILTELYKVILGAIPGEVVEFGCYNGTTSLFIRRLLPADRQLYVYDSFEGLPNKTSEDESPLGKDFQAGKLRSSKSELIRNFKKSGLTLPIIRKAWFSELTTRDIPQQIAFAFLDGDYYESIKTSLQLIWPQMSPGAIVVVDDYDNEALPGAARAVDEWLIDHKVKSFRVESSLAVMVLAPSK